MGFVMFSRHGKTFYANIKMLDQNCVPILERIEQNLDHKIELRYLDSAETEMARAVNAFLLHLCLGDAATRVHAAEDSNGFETWHLLCRCKLTRSSAASMGQFMEPTFASRDPRVNLQQWKK